MSVGEGSLAPPEPHGWLVALARTGVAKGTDRDSGPGSAFLAEGVATIDREWRSELPDGREVVVQRHGEQWIVHCGSAHAISTNLDIALAETIHAETLSPRHPHQVHYPAWIRRVADELTSE